MGKKNGDVQWFPFQNPMVDFLTVPFKRTILGSQFSDTPKCH